VIKKCIIIFIALILFSSCDPENKYIFKGEITDENRNSIELDDYSFICYPTEATQNVTTKKGIINNSFSSLFRYDSITILIKETGFIEKRVSSYPSDWKIKRKIMKTEFYLDYGIIKLETKPKRNLIEIKIGKIATSFHKWYIKNTNEYNNEIATNYKISQKKNGYCKVNFQPYFSELKKLGTISNTFMNKEIERTKKCVENIESLKWTEYDGIPEYCDDFSYWTQSQDFEGGNVEVNNITKKDDYWVVQISLFFKDKNGEHNVWRTANVNVKKENGKFMIMEINWIE